MTYDVGLCFGAFDPLHYGHIRLFQFADIRCAKVVACTESDDIIELEKRRPAFTREADRIDDLYSIIHLNEVVMRTTTRDRASIAKEVKADVLIVGADWEGRWEEGETLGLPILYAPYIDSASSTSLREAHAFD